jgi:hypothetical protein
MNGYQRDAYANRGMDCGADEVQQPQVLSDLDALDKALANLAEEWNTLHSKLGPVLPPPCDGVGDKSPGQIEPARSQIALRIHCAKEQADGIARWVRNARNDIQL